MLIDNLYRSAKNKDYLEKLLMLVAVLYDFLAMICDAINAY